MKYQEELLSVFLYLGYITSIGILGLIIFAVGFYFYQVFINFSWVNKQIHNRAINKRLYLTSEEDLEKWFDDIRERYNKLKGK